MRTTPDLSAAVWRKSSYSNTNGGNCVEVADGLDSAVPVRDSKDPQGPALLFPTAAWASFIAGIKTGDFPTSP
ncbi:DUF397 domain-containing protein [Wenjunlia tyrosinilytica]|uniref:DUF397 domain-containing protein n=1 Tax=Wenjunlia tyrosinilytica TaxID=1544741 RepID=A0A917ZNC1_9ACTN|nr:DUF397 domain-containing protein [Wenjunlia tyrosinilytica]GGO86930.1 hypothetical protein GCM10012280_24220 [Wenjunlia tyrosinilytica]